MKFRGRKTDTTPIKTTSSFDLALLVQAATEIELLDAPFDDLEHGLMASSPSLDNVPASKKPFTGSSQLHPTQSRRNQKRAIKRRKKISEEGHSATNRTLFEHVQLADSLEVAIETNALRRTKRVQLPPYLISSSSPLDLNREYSIDDLVSAGFRVFPWDGR